MATLVAPSTSVTRSRSDLTDHELVAAVRGGDDGAFEELYARYRRRITAYALGMVKDHGRAEDLTQDVFLSALRRMRETDRPIQFKPWLYEIAKNACIDAFRRGRRGEEVSWDAEERGLAPADQRRLALVGTTPEAQVAAKQDLDHLRGAFEELPEVQHQILVMRELGGLSYHEIGERLDMTLPAVESTLFRARRRLTEEYEELASGKRCVRVQSIIGGARGCALGLRDQRRVGRHIATCAGCRRDARLAGLDADRLARRPVRAKIAAVLPLPAFLRDRWLPGGAGHVVTSPWTLAATQFGEPAASGWLKAVAAVAAVTLASAGAGDGSSTVDRGARDGSSSRPARAVAAVVGAPASSTAAATPSTGRRALAAGVRGARAVRPGSGAAGTSVTGRHPVMGTGARSVPGSGSSTGSGAPVAGLRAGAPATSRASAQTSSTRSAPSSSAPAATTVASPSSTPSLPAPGETVTGVTGAVGDAVGGPLGQTVSGLGTTVGGAVDGTVATVTGEATQAVDTTVQGVAGVVGNVVGGLTGTRHGR